MKGLRLAIASFLWALGVALGGASLPTGFTETGYSGLTSPTAMALAPDGRIFVCEQAGKLRVIKNGALLTTPFVTLTVDPAGERGSDRRDGGPELSDEPVRLRLLHGAGQPAHNRLSRFTANGDVAVPGSETILLELDNLSSATNHNGGALHFGRGREALHRVGQQREQRELADADEPARQDAAAELGRLDPDGQPVLQPADGQEPGDLGLRPAQPVHVRHSAGDRADLRRRRGREHLGGDQRRGRRAPTTGGRSARARAVRSTRCYTDPFYWYQHINGQCAITGGDFYNPRDLRSSRRATSASTSSRISARAGSTTWIRRPRALRRP